MQVVLVMFRAEGDRRSFSITRDVTVIGRREDCDLRIPVSEVSRKHCRVMIDGDSVLVEDLGSSNGTFHNGQRISGSVTLQPGDSIEVGPVVFVLQVDGTPPDDELAPFEERAAHELDDSLATHPPEAPAVDAEAAAEHLEELEELSPAMEEQEEQHEALPLSDESAAPIALSSSGDADAGELDLSGHVDHDAGTGMLNEDELLLDLNIVQDAPEKH